MATLSVEFDFVPKLKGRYVAYLRTSERPNTKLDIIAQRDAVAALMSKSPTRLIKTFVEQEPLIDGRRPALEEAVGFCKAYNATLVFGRIRRMRSGFRWLKFARDHDVKFIGADMPGINSSTWWSLHNRDQSWRFNKSREIKEVLAKAKALGVSLGGKRGISEGLKLGPSASAISRQRRAKSRAWYTMREIELLRHRGITTLTAMATRLNQMGHPAPRGGTWSPAQVRSVIKKFEG